jgi:hypothetical protein
MMPMPRSAWLCAFGLVALATICWRLVAGAMSLSQAGLRAGVLLAVLVVADRLVLPLARSFIGTPGRSRT